MDVRAYWDAVDAELATVAPAAAIEPIPKRSTEDFTGYEMRLNSIGPYRIFGYLSIPTGAGPFPALLETPRYGSVINPPHYDDRLRYVTLTVAHRGQRLADVPFAAEYPGLLTRGIDNPAEYIYRGIVADCLRAAEFLCEHPAVDTGRIGINGDDLALITAARRPVFAAVRVRDLLFYRAADKAADAATYPLRELRDHLRHKPSAGAAIRESLSLLDVSHHVGAIHAPTLLCIGGDTPTPSDLVDAFPRPPELYRSSHKGAIDQQAIDRWLGDRLGTGHGSRFMERLS